MNYFVKNVTSETIVLCDLYNIVLPPNEIVNLLLFTKQSDIEASADYALALSNGYIQVGAWRPGTFIIKQYNKSPDRTNLDNIDTITLSTISGYPSTCGTEFSVNITAPFLLNADPIMSLEAATKQYSDRVSAAALASALEADKHLHDGDIIIGGDLDVMGILTAYNIVTQTINGISTTGGDCTININCDLDLLNHTIRNVNAIYPDDIYVDRIFIDQYAQFGSSGSIRDDNGIQLIQFPVTITNAVNYLTIDNSISGNSILLTAEGTDTNINLRIYGKADGNVIFSPVNPLVPVFRPTRVAIGDIEPQELLHLYPGPTKIYNDATILIQGHGYAGHKASVLFKTSWGWQPTHIKGGIIWEDAGILNARGNLHICVNTTNDSSNVSVSDSKITFGTDGKITLRASLQSNSDEITIEDDVLIDGNLEVINTIYTSILSVSQITGISTTSHPCIIDINCDLSLLNHDIYNIDTLEAGMITGTNFISTVLTGTQPYACTSTTVNANLNADLLDGIHATVFRKKITDVIIVDADGNGDYTTIAGAISVAASGDTIKVMPGTYNENLLSLPNGVSIIGEDKLNSIIQSLGEEGEAIISLGGNNEVAHITITNTNTESGQAIASTTNNVYLHDMVLSGGIDVISLINCDNWVIEHVVFGDFPYDGIILTNCTRVFIRNCVVNATPTNTGHCSFINLASGTVDISDCDITLARSANEGILSYVRCAVNGTVYSKNNKVNLNGGNQNTFGFSQGGGASTANIYSYFDIINLTSSGTATSVDGEGSGSFNAMGGNILTVTGATPITPLEQGDLYAKSLKLDSGGNVILSTTTGTKIGTATNQLLGFYNVTPVDQPTTVSDPAGGGTIDAEARTAINTMIDRLQELGLIA